MTATPTRSATPASPEAQTVPLIMTMPPSNPTRVRIPAIRVNAPLAGLGLDAKGHPAAPAERDGNLAGWYTNGAKPGTIGTALIAGHVDNWQGPAVFYNLGALHRGDEIDVDRADGNTAVFAIDAVEAYPASAFPNQEVYGWAQRAELRIMTSITRRTWATWSSSRTWSPPSPCTEAGPSAEISAETPWLRRPVI